MALLFAMHSPLGQRSEDFSEQKHGYNNHSYGKWPFMMEQSTMSMVIFPWLSSHHLAGTLFINTDQLHHLQGDFTGN